MIYGDVMLERVNVPCFYFAFIRFFLSSVVNVSQKCPHDFSSDASVIS